MQTAKIVAGLGGIENIDEVRGELLQIDVEVVDPSLVDEVALKAAGARSVVKNGEKVTVVLGEEAPRVATEIEDMM
ncbi:PTS sugar transporter (plasmid) [Streptomyces sp. NBC_00440]|uniref:PTS sugar transporter n=1 Tax=unclassified Streptomyces TaxID=2593676 RepID=UPI002E21CF94|nr:PTS sugar transporter [Streptomyces sp. NBC_00963]